MNARHHLWVVASLLWAIGCSVTQVAEAPAPITGGQLVVYLQPLPQSAQYLRFTLDGITAIGQDDNLVPFDLAFTDLNGKLLIGRQKRLATGSLPPGSYSGVEIDIRSAFIMGEEGEAALLVTKSPVTITRPFEVIRGEATALFLSLASNGKTAGGVFFEPEFSLAVAGRQLFNLSGYISNAKANRLTVFNKKTMQVIDVIATGRRPTGMAVGRFQRRIYVACTDDDRIEEIDIVDNAVKNRIELRVGDGPLDLVVTPDGQSLLSANFASNTVSLIDVRSRVEISRFSVGRRPTAVVVDETGTYAFAVNSLSNSVTVLDLQRLAPVAELDVDTTPLRAALEPSSSRLFVINRDSPNLSVIRVEQLVVTDKVFAGAGAIAIVANPQTGLVYVGNDTGDIQVFDPTSLIFVDSISAAGPVKHLTIDREENSLFAVRPEKNTLQKVNLTSKRVLAEIEVEQDAYEVVVVGER